MTELTIATGHTVAFHYRLTDPEGVEIDASAPDSPLTYEQGAGQIVPGLEQAMIGHAVGDSFDVEVSPAEGYGERLDIPPQAVPRSAFPEGVEIQEGMAFMGQDEQGNMLPLWVVAVQEDVVLIDAQHPLAGVPLHFAIEIVSIEQ